MLTRIRQRLRLIRYYSAARPRTAWSKALDVALFASLVLAFPINVVCSLSIHEPVDSAQVRGNLYSTPEGGLAAYTLESPLARDVNVTVESTGTFALTALENRHGWPLPTWAEVPPPNVALDLFDEGAARPATSSPLDERIRAAIADALEREDRHDILAAWRDRAHTRRHLVVGWIFGTGIWWVMLSFASVLIIKTLHHGWRIATGRAKLQEVRRTVEGQCPNCGYDMRGLEFNERCPECGRLV